VVAIDFGKVTALSSEITHSQHGRPMQSNCQILTY
jgi:hypothetical protein